MIRKTKNRSGVTETRIVSCAECGEEYCNGKMCVITNYDMFARLKVEVETKTSRTQATLPQGASKLRRMRRRVRRKPRSKSAAPAALAARKPHGNKSGARSDSEL
ncbi:uncharacterized protein LOC119189375 [Manduca sexta]|nr:uncharacterized protein LOC119189375 [Manduca sexta]